MSNFFNPFHALWNRVLNSALKQSIPGWKVKDNLEHPGTEGTWDKRRNPHDSR